jgi:hypothetical protein
MSGTSTEPKERIVVVNAGARAENASEAAATAARSGSGMILPSEQELSACKATSVAQRFTDERKYDGSPSSDFGSVISRYQDRKADYALSDNELRRFFHIFFSRDAKRFYDTDPSISRATSIEIVRDIIAAHFIHSSQRNAITSELGTLSIAKEMRNGTDSREALTLVLRGRTP